MYRYMKRHGVASRHKNSKISQNKTFLKKILISQKFLIIN